MKSGFAYVLFAVSMSALVGSASAQSIDEELKRLDEQPVERAETMYNSVAAALWSSGGRNRVSVGYAVRNSPEEAKRAAVAACAKNGARNCVAKGAWSSGCLYITTASNGSSRMAWGSGPTVADAIRECQKNGVRCDRDAIGGCVNE